MRAAILKPKDREFKSISDFNYEWSDRIALLIILGLLVDVGNAFVPNNSFWKLPLTIVADVLIIAGLWGESWFLKRARKADDSRVAEAEKALAAAVDRAGKLEKEAAEARERTARIEELTAFRHISPEQHRNIVAALRGKIEPSVNVLIEWERGDTEAFLYAWQISNVLEETRGTKNRFNPNSWLDWHGFGVWMNSDKSVDLRSIAAAFEDAGIHVNVQDREATEAIERPRWRHPWDGIELYIFVAPKIPPQIEKFAATENAKSASDSSARE
jgi:hypothetical protein